MRPITVSVATHGRLRPKELPASDAERQLHQRRKGPVYLRAVRDVGGAAKPRSRAQTIAAPRLLTPILP